MHTNEPHFDQPIAAWAATGATVGAVAVLAIFVMVILLSGSDVELMAVAGLAAAFGGTGFGAMLGAVLASIRQVTVQTVSAREPGDEIRRRVMPS